VANLHFSLWITDRKPQHKCNCKKWHSIALRPIKLYSCKIIANSQTDNPIQKKDLEEEELLQGKFQPTQMKESREAFQLMAADPDFKKKHTANSEEEAIQKSKTRTGKWQYNSIMNWGISLYKSAFDFDETKSGPFSVVKWWVANLKAE
jgi:hypothetical protein